MLNIFTSLLGAFPLTKVFKLAAILAVVASIFGGGYYVGNLTGEKKMQVEIKRLEAKLATEVRNHTEAVKAWEKARADLATEAALALETANAQARKAEAQAQAAIAKVNKDWADRLQRTKNDAQAALDRVLNPVTSNDPLTDGMWIDATSCEAGTRDHSQGNPSGVPEAGNSDAPKVLRCRLHPAVAERLIQSAAAANQVVNDYNACVDSLRVLSPQSFGLEVRLGQPKEASWFGTHRLGELR